MPSTPNPRSLPIAIDPSSFNMTATRGNCDANISATRQQDGTRIALDSGNLARSPLWPADRQSHRPDGDLVSPIVMYGPMTALRCSCLRPRPRFPIPDQGNAKTTNVSVATMATYCLPFRP